jgi:hypothetical protein
MPRYTEYDVVGAPIGAQSIALIPVYANQSYFTSPVGFAWVRSSGGPPTCNTGVRSGRMAKNLAVGGGRAVLVGGR